MLLGLDVDGLRLLQRSSPSLRVPEPESSRFLGKLGSKGRLQLSSIGSLRRLTGSWTNVEGHEDVPDQVRRHRKQTYSSGTAVAWVQMFENARF